LKYFNLFLKFAINKFIKKDKSSASFSELNKNLTAENKQEISNVLNTEANNQ